MLRYDENGVRLPEQWRARPAQWAVALLVGEFVRSQMRQERDLVENGGRRAFRLWQAGVRFNCVPATR